MIQPTPSNTRVSDSGLVHFTTDGRTWSIVGRVAQGERETATGERAWYWIMTRPGREIAKGYTYDKQASAFACVMASQR